MKNKVMNYKEFMSVSQGVNKASKANIGNKDSKGKSGIKQDLANDPITGAGTSHLQKFTKSYLATVKAKNMVKGK
jgi:hypothetical protein|tara:strand:+ start:6332 stop:6556 length:225 start_codon:yes stop_codon:yes gene_type:complete